MIRVRWLPKGSGSEQYLEGPYHIEIRDDGTVEMYKHETSTRPLQPEWKAPRDRGMSAQQFEPGDWWDRIIIEEVP